MPLRSSPYPALFLCALATALFAPAPLHASSVARGGTNQSNSSVGPVSLVVQADAVRFTVRVTTDQELVDYQLYEIGEARKHLLEAVTRNGKLTTTPNTPEPDFSRPSRFNLSSSGDPGRTQATVDLFYPIKPGFDLIACAREVNALIQGLKLPDKARYRYTIESASLWVADPEKNRLELLKRFAAEVHAMSDALGGKVKFTVSDLATPIRQQPIGDTQVELSLNPTVTLEIF